MSFRKSLFGLLANKPNTDYSEIEAAELSFHLPENPSVIRIQMKNLRIYRNVLSPQTHRFYFHYSDHYKRWTISNHSGDQLTDPWPEEKPLIFSKFSEPQNLYKIIQEFKNQKFTLFIVFYEIPFLQSTQNIDLKLTMKSRWRFNGAWFSTVHMNSDYSATFRFDYTEARKLKIFVGKATPLEILLDRKEQGM